MQIEIIKIDNNNARIIFDYYEPFETLRNNFSTLEKNFGYIQRCRARNIKVHSSKEYIQKSCIKRSGEFELGLLFDILQFCRSTFYDRIISFVLDDGIKNYITSNNLKLNSKVIVNETNAKPRQYQIDSMQIALNKTNGLYILGTGAGKTLCTALLVHNLLKHKLVKKILIICPFPDLANQTYKELLSNLREYKYTFSKWFGTTEFNKKTNVVIAGSSIVRSQYKLYKNDLEKFDCIIVDEAHQLKSNNKISEIISNLPAKFRYGFTGTLPDNKHDLWSLKGKIGPVRYELPSAELRKDNFLTNVTAIGMNVTLNDIPTFNIDENGNKTPFTYNDEVEWLSLNEEFNIKIANIAKITKNNTLILFNRTNHGEYLVELCKNLLPDKQIFLIQGDVSLFDRDDIKAMMEKENNIVLIAQVATFSVGINVKNISNLIFAGIAGKSSIRIIQSIGRILRLHDNKQMAMVFDIIPNTKYCLKHSDVRKKIYEREKINYLEKSLNA